MRIAYLSTQVGFYGGEVHVRQLAAGLANRGHDVFCVVRPRSALAARLREAGLDVITLPLLDWYEPVGAARLGRLLRRRAPDIVHTHTPRDHYLAAVATAGGAAVNVGTRHQLRPFGAVWLKRPFLRRLAAMIAVSAAVRDTLLRARAVPPARIVTIPNGIDAGRRPAAPAGWRRARGLDATTPVIGYVGRLSPEKGLEVLLDAARRLCPAGGAQAHWLIVGGDPSPRGGYAARLRRLAEASGMGPRVHFLGYVEDAAAAAADFDIHVVPSRAEPFGLVTLEAMASARAVVATRAGGSPEIVRDGVDGLLVPPDDPAALAAALARLLDDPRLRSWLGNNARRRVRREFDEARMLDRVEALYARVAGGGLP